MAKKPAKKKAAKKARKIDPRNKVERAARKASPKKYAAQDKKTAAFIKKNRAIVKKYKGKTLNATQQKQYETARMNLTSARQSGTFGKTGG